MVVIRPMQSRDCKAVSELEKEVFRLPWSEQGFLDALESQENIFLLAEEDGQVAGYLGMYIALDEGEITNVAVDPQKRKLGIGDKLIKEALILAKEKGVLTVVLEVRISNTPAIHLYEKNGFWMCGIRKGFYEFPKEDAYIMMYNQ